MAYQPIDLTSPADSLPTGGAKINANFAELYAADAAAQDSIAALALANLTVAQSLTTRRRSYVAKNTQLVGGLYSLTQCAEAAEDTRAYVDRVSVVTAGDDASTAATVTSEGAVRNAINAIYTYVGKASLIDAWFLSTSHNVIGTTSVPAFLSASNNGTKVGSTLPTFSEEGAEFLAADLSAVQLPTGLNVANFTDIVIYQPSAKGGGDGLMGNFSSNSGNYGGYYLGMRWSDTPSSEYLGGRWSGSASAGDTSITAKPDAGRWQTAALSYVSGTQSIYLNGRYVKGGTGTQAIDTTGRQICIGAWGYAASAAWGTFTGKVIFACKISGTPTKEVMCRLMSALRAILQPANGQINLVALGDSRTAGTALAAGVFSAKVDSTDDQTVFWPNMLMSASNWIGKGAAQKLGIPSISARALDLGGAYERLARQYRPGWQNTYLLLWAGVNDFQASGGTRTAAETYGHWAAIATKARADGMIVVALNQPEAAGYVTAGRVPAYNALLLASALWDFHIDVYGLLTPGGVENATLYDGLHLTSAGNTALVALINSTIAPEVLAH